MSLYSLFTTGNIMNKEFCFDKIVNELDKLENETYKNTPMYFYAVVTNVETGKAEYKKIDDAKEGLEIFRATGSMPFVSRLVEIEGNKYLDGAISDPIPIEKVIAEGYGKIVVVLTREENYQKPKERNPYNLVYGKYPNFVKTALAQPEFYNNTLKLIKKYEDEAKIIVLRPSQNLKIARVEKNVDKLKAIYQLGIDDSTLNLEKIKNYLNEKIPS